MVEAFLTQAIKAAEKFSGARWDSIKKISFFKRGIDSLDYLERFGEDYFEDNSHEITVYIRHEKNRDGCKISSFN